MFDEFLKNCPMQDKIKPSKKRVKKNIAAVNSLIETEEGTTMTKSGFKLKPLIIAAVILILSAVSLLSVNAATKGAVVNFILGGKSVEGEYYDYVDDEGFRHISFGAELPMYSNNFVLLYDVDAPQGENVRVITDETDPDFMGKLLLYKEAYKNARENGRKPVDPMGSSVASVEYTDFMPPRPEDFGLVFKDSELCTCYLASDGELYNAYFGGEFMNMDIDSEKPSGGYKEEYSRFDYLRGTKTFKVMFYYYVGKE